MSIDQLPTFLVENMAKSAVSIGTKSRIKTYVRAMGSKAGAGANRALGEFFDEFKQSNDLLWFLTVVVTHQKG